MSFNHRDAVAYFAKIVATMINYAIMVGVIILVGVIIYTFYLFIVDPYHGKKDPSKMKNLWKSNNTTTFILDYSTYKS